MELKPQTREGGLKEIDEAKWGPCRDDEGRRMPHLEIIVHSAKGFFVRCTISRRQQYCDRGHVQLMIDGFGLDIDHKDCFPRYFFSYEEADKHCRDFLRWRLWKHSPTTVRKLDEGFFALSGHDAKEVEAESGEISQEEFNKLAGVEESNLLPRE